MLKLYTFVDKSKNEKIVVNMPWYKYFSKYRVTNSLDETDVELVSKVENTSIINNSTIESKFLNMPIGIGDLSEGCKTLLCINHAIKTKTADQYIFNITSCGGNAIQYLAENMTKDADVYAIVEHSDFGYGKDAHIQIDDDKTYTDTMKASRDFIDKKLKQMGD